VESLTQMIFGIGKIFLKIKNDQFGWQGN